jgi:hypothetical protein
VYAKQDFGLWPFECHQIVEPVFISGKEELFRPVVKKHRGREICNKLSKMEN